MPPLRYHAGQLRIQEEAKTTIVARKLADWVGPVIDFALGADMFLLVSDDQGELRFTVLSGNPPLLTTEGGLGRRHLEGEEADEVNVRLRFPANLLPPPSQPTQCGGLAISLASARRARINGVLTDGGETTDMRADETFTLCRKYIAPSVPLDTEAYRGPVRREPISLDDGWLAGLLSRAETSFLATISPEGGLDISHRGGPPGFLRLEPSHRSLIWEEYVGDGIFKGAGNLRATRRFTLLVPEIETGNGVELVGTGNYINVRGERRQRLDALVQHRDEFPVQGRISCVLDSAYRLAGLMQPRRLMERSVRVTSASRVEQQAPQ